MIARQVLLGLADDGNLRTPVRWPFISSGYFLSDCFSEQTKVACQKTPGMVETSSDMGWSGLVDFAVGITNERLWRIDG